VNKCDIVYHLAAAVGVRLIVEQPVHTMVTNVGHRDRARLLQPLRQAC
jgi:nucleoside-diphosphate-sugar epimerase